MMAVLLKKQYFEKEVDGKEITEEKRIQFEQKIKLITLMALTNKYCLLAPTGPKGKPVKGSAKQTPKVIQEKSSNDSDPDSEPEI